MVRKGYYNMIDVSITSDFHIILVLIVIFISVYMLFITNLDIFRLSYILPRSICKKLVYINQFMANMPISYSLKTREN